MKNYALTFVLALSVVAAGSSLRKSLEAIGGSPTPYPPKPLAIGGSPTPYPPKALRIGGSPTPYPPKGGAVTN